MKPRSETWPRNDVFTTGEAAIVCMLGHQTIIRLFDCGLIPGYRLPGSRVRRIPREALRRFMEKHGIPTDALRPQEGGAP